MRDPAFATAQRHNVSRRSFLIRAACVLAACLAHKSPTKSNTVIVNGWILNVSDLAGL